MLPYDHTQRSTVLTGLVAAVLVGTAVLVGVAEGPGSALVAVAVTLPIVAVVGVVFSSLRVRVDDDITLAFGRGWPRKRIALDSVESVEVVRSSPLVGIGIRWFPGGTMWNVWGLDAVELELSSGRRFRIGTDEPAELLAAIEARR